MISMSPEDAYRQLATASLVVRDRSPIEVSVPCIEAAFGLLDWGQDSAPTPRLRQFATDALVSAVVPRPRLFGRVDTSAYAPAHLVPPPNGAA